MQKENTRRGFTLIELLVIVLIIAILAAIALPQYQKSVVKSRFAEAFVNLKTLDQAVKVCELEGNKECAGIDVFVKSNIDVPQETDFFYFNVMPGSPGKPGPFSVAQYKKENVCLCLMHSGKFVVYHQSDEADCGSSQEPTLNYAKLLNVANADDFEEGEEEWDCACC